MIDYRAILKTLSKNEIVESILCMNNQQVLSRLATKAQDKHLAEVEKMLDEMDELADSGKAADHFEWILLNDKYKSLEKKWDKMWNS